jgi:hypothetical protein
MWRGVAPALAEKFTVVCADLPGYGRSGCPPSDALHERNSKRALADDMVSVMDRLGREWERRDQTRAGYPSVSVPGMCFGPGHDREHPVVGLGALFHERVRLARGTVLTGGQRSA